ncbi:MAG: hypothetical protein OXC48_01785, partial [Endozoicomonadaceae bacterium]|nr:hypothetical protein [Endozoicomonadaceae bacterium]
MQWVGKRPKELSCKDYHHCRLCEKSKKLQQRLSKQFDVTVHQINATSNFVFMKRGVASHQLPPQIITQCQKGETLRVNKSSGKHLEVFSDSASVHSYFGQLIAELTDNLPFPDQPKGLHMQLVANLNEEIKLFTGG